MEQRTEETLSPYRVFSRADWAQLRADTPMTLTPAEVGELRSLNDRLDMNEVEEIYLPLSRLLSLYVAATQRLYRAQQNFLGTEDTKVPYIIGVAGSVAVGKSTTARVLKALLARWRVGRMLSCRLTRLIRVQIAVAVLAASASESFE